MLRLLIDENISPSVGEGLRRRNKAMVVHWIAEWEGGRFMGLPDDLLLKEALGQRLTLVTYDRRTIPPLLKQWAEGERNHGGVIFVDQKTIAPSDFGGLIRALEELWGEGGKWEWKNRVLMLARKRD